MLKVGAKVELMCNYGALQGIISDIDENKETIRLQSGK
jgi:hypothetical protein